MGPEQPPQGLPPPGWYEDPENPDGQPRWWDGARWTDQYGPAPAPEPTQAQWIGGILLLAIPAVLRGVHNANRDETTAYVIGSVLGAMTGATLLALLIRWIYVRFSERERPVWSPWVFVIATVIATLALLGTIASDAEDDDDDANGKAVQFDAAGAECDSAGVEAFPSLAPRLTYRELTEAERSRIVIPAGLPPALEDAFQLRMVEAGKTPVAVLTVAAVGTDPSVGADVRAGFTDGLTQSGRQLKTFTVAGGTEVPYTKVATGEVVALAPIDCFMRVVSAGDLPTARFIAGRLGAE